MRGGARLRWASGSGDSDACSRPLLSSESDALLLPLIACCWHHLPIWIGLAWDGLALVTLPLEVGRRSGEGGGGRGPGCCCSCLAGCRRERPHGVFLVVIHACSCSFGCRRMRSSLGGCTRLARHGCGRRLAAAAGGWVSELGLARLLASSGQLRQARRLADRHPGKGMRSQAHTPNKVLRASMAVAY